MTVALPAQPAQRTRGADLRSRATRTASAVRPIRRVRRGAALAVVLLRVLIPANAPAQAPPEAGVPVRPVAFRAEPMSPEFGETFDLHVTIRVAPGTLLLLPDTLVPAEASQSAGHASWRTEAAPGDSLDVVATYPVMGLANGEVELPSLEGETIADPGAAAAVSALAARSPDEAVPGRPFALRIGRVQVIPHRALGAVEGVPLARPPADVAGGNWSLWAIGAALVGMGVGALAIAYAVGLWRRIGERRRAAGLRRLPRRDALAALDALLGRGWHRTGRVDAFYQEASEIFRGFAAKAQSSWSEDLTSTELVGRIVEREGADATGNLRPTVVSGEGVRFGAARPDATSAEEHVTALAEWIARTGSAPSEGEDGGP